MDEDLFYGVAAALVVLFGGMIVFVPVLALALRFALQPALETWARLREGQLADREHQQLARQVELLEAELQQVQRAVQALAEAHEFQRQLAPAGQPGMEDLPGMEARGDRR